MENKEHPLDQPIFSKADLILRYYRGELSTAESGKLEQWFAQDAANQQFADKLQDEVFLQDQLDFFSSVDSETAWQKVAGKIDKLQPKTTLWQNATYFKYAAVLVMLCLTGLLAYKYRGAVLKNPAEMAVTKKRTAPVKLLPPATSNQAQLTLSNGAVINLDDLKDGVIWNQKGFRITKQEKEINFSFLPEVDPKANKTGRNTLTIPTGRQYKIILPDGSQVWLNAASTLQFADSFKSKNREVALTGEAYFEVAKSKHQPFIVKANHTTVEVLGTHFNVMAYPEESSVNTTLLEGSVKIGNASQNKIIKPGYQAKVSKTIAVEKVNVKAAVAWKNNLFHFQNTELEIITRELERWYGIEFVITGPLPKQHFTGIISRQMEISKILKMLELSGNIGFKTAGKKVIIQQIGN